jgi:predicted signal transduction protein with EAL and GGDEF domain
VSRYGGEEFALLLPRTDLATACNLCERTRAAIAANLSVTVSIGLAASLPDDTGDSLLARSDAALYMAKGEGRNCVYFHEGLPARIVGIHVADASSSHAGTKKPRAIAPPLSIAGSVGDEPAPCYQGEAC